MSKTFQNALIKNIEDKLQWAESSTWTTEDFKLLAEKVFAKTGVKLSTSTLKRVWGTISYDSNPSTSTLNALAQFLDFESFSDFRNKHSLTIKSGQSIEVKTQGTRPKVSKYVASIAVIVIVFFSVLGLSFLKSQGNTEAYDYESVRFSSNPVTKGLPNSVVFNYDFGNNTVENAQIQQSWNSALTFDIDQSQKQATCFYYFPGYFRAKLLADGNILKEHDLKVATEGWMATIGRSGQPRYLYYGELIEDETLHLSEEVSKSIHSKEQENADWLTYHYYDSLPEVRGDFNFELKFKNTYQKSNGICQRVEILIQGSERVFQAPFTIPGCTSEVNLFHAGSEVSGKTNDLSVFGTNISEWQKFNLKIEGKSGKYFLNDELIFEREITNEIGELVGFKLRFEGNGEVDYLKLSQEGQLVFSQDFYR